MVARSSAMIFFLIIIDIIGCLELHKPPKIFVDRVEFIGNEFTDYNLRSLDRIDKQGAIFIKDCEDLPRVEERIKVVGFPFFRRKIGIKRSWSKRRSI